MIDLPPDLFYDCENVALLYNNVLFAVQLYFCAGIFGIDNLIAFFFAHDDLFAIDLSISNRDYPVVQAVIVLMAFWVVLVNFLADIINQRLDPRLRLQ